MPAAYIYVDRPVCALQAMLETLGAVSLMLDATYGKNLGTSVIGPETMILVSGLNQNLFSGIFLSCDMPVMGIHDVVTSDADGNNAHGVVGKISKVSGVVCSA
jgi:hypothetical protein